LLESQAFAVKIKNTRGFPRSRSKITVIPSLYTHVFEIWEVINLPLFYANYETPLHFIKIHTECCD